MSQLNVDDIYNKDATGNPNLPVGVKVVGVSTFLGSQTELNVAGVSTFAGQLNAGTVSASTVSATTYDEIEYDSWLFG
jgi:hypothetical protein